MVKVILDIFCFIKCVVVFGSDDMFYFWENIQVGCLYIFRMSVISFLVIGVNEIYDIVLYFGRKLNVKLLCSRMVCIML